MNEPPRYVVHKKSRMALDKTFLSMAFYHAKIGHLYKEVYDSYDEAMVVAEKLSQYNPVGFTVSQVND